MVGCQELSVHGLYLMVGAPSVFTQILKEEKSCMYKVPNSHRLSKCEMDRQVKLKEREKRFRDEGHNTFCKNTRTSFTLWN